MIAATLSLFGLAGIGFGLISLWHSYIANCRCSALEREVERLRIQNAEFNGKPSPSWKICPLDVTDEGMGR